MKSCFRVGIFGGLLLSLACGAGCSICASPDLEAYPATGGLWQRTDRDHGRVGSVFAPAGYRVDPVVGSAEEDLEPAGEGDADREESQADNGDPQSVEPAPEEAAPAEQPVPPMEDIEIEDIRPDFRQRQRTTPST